MDVQQVAPKKSNTLRNILVVVGLGVAIVCVCISILVGQGVMQALSPEGQATSTARAIAVLTASGPTATFTTTPSPTVTPTDTATPTATPTIPPQTQTSEALATARRVNELNATATREAIQAAGTATRRSISGTATEIASYTTIANGELITYADNHIGEQIRIFGRVFNIIDTTTLQIYLSGTFDAVYISLRVPLVEVYEDNNLTIYGTVAGEQCGQNAFGGTVCQPVLIDAFYVR